MHRRHLGPLMILTLVSLLLAIPPAAPAYDYTYARVVRLSRVEGDVQVARPRVDNDEQSKEAVWEQAEVNLPIQQGFSLATGQGRAEIEFESGATARLAENSLLQFTELALASGGRITRLTLTQGTATFYANLSRDDSFVVATPHLQVVVPERATFRLDVTQESSTVGALKGEVEVDSRAGTNRLTKGRELTYRTSDPDRVSIDRLSKSDDWNRWVVDRDEVIRTGSTTALQYVSSPYSYGLSDLSTYGSWYGVSGYGQCWRPFGVGFGWSPFWSGRWAFFPGLGWTWVSFERWGWLPYHFGNWVFSPALGWVWVPGFGHHWHPGLVSWVRVGDRIGWVPMHPNDQPGQMSANIQHGVILPRSRAFNRTDRLERRMIGREEKIEVVRDLPPAFAATPRRGSKSAAGPPTAGITGGGNDQREIVFDPKERKFVNNPAAGTPRANSRTDGKTNGTGDANVEAGSPRTSRGAAGITPSMPNTPPPPRVERSFPQSESSRPSPRSESAPQPRAQSQPSSPRAPSPPPPRVERSFPQSESSRPSPRSEPAPRPRAQSQPSSPRAPSPPPPRVERSYQQSESSRPSPRSEPASRPSPSSSSHSSSTPRAPANPRR